MAIVIGIVVGGVAGVLAVRSKHRGDEAQISLLATENSRLAGELGSKADEAKALTDEKTSLVARAQVLEKEIEHLNSQIGDADAQHRRQLDEERQKAQDALDSLRENDTRMYEALKNQLADERTHAADMRKEADRQWSERLEALRQEMQKNAAEQLAAKQKDLQQSNSIHMEELLKPIKEQFEAFKRMVNEGTKAGEVNKNVLQKTFEDTMKLFQQQQDQAVAALKEQTQRIGSDAANLTKALKGDSKIQGDWGEMVLDKMLEGSGLRRDEEYFVQENVKDEEGNNLRPDVIVRFPEGRSVVIDSKVSLTAYSNAVAADNDNDRDRYLNEHVVSVRKHVDELAAKDYSKIVKDAIGFVLMFIPNEAAYIAAMRTNPNLSRYAYQKRIIIISPSNLLMTLQLAYNLWQNDRQNKNVEKIVKTAASLYDKVAGFEETFSGIGEAIKRLQTNYEKAQGQLYTGKGNVMRQTESLKSLGVTPRKRLKDIDELPAISPQGDE